MAARADFLSMTAAESALALPDLAAIREAAARIAPHVHRTPVMTCAAIDAEIGASLFFKCEHLQRVGRKRDVPEWRHVHDCREPGCVWRLFGRAAGDSVVQCECAAPHFCECRCRRLPHMRFEAGGHSCMLGAQRREPRDAARWARYRSAIECGEFVQLRPSRKSDCHLLGKEQLRRGDGPGWIVRRCPVECGWLDDLRRKSDG